MMAEEIKWAERLNTLECVVRARHVEEFDGGYFERELLEQVRLEPTGLYCNVTRPH